MLVYPMEYALVEKIILSWTHFHPLGVLDILMLASLKLQLHFQESFHFSQLEKLLDIDSEFVALLKLEVRSKLKLEN